MNKLHRLRTRLARASAINNEGFTRQAEYLFESGVTPDDLETA
jgi:hypothetical protein